jgi:hypothetical protein
VSLSALNFGHAQEFGTNAHVNSLSDLEVMLETIESTTPVPASQLPASGTFWSAQHALGSATPWPPLPSNILGLDVWPLGDGVYLLDDTNVNYTDMPQSRLVSDFDMNSQFQLFTTNDLWLQINSLTNNGAGWMANLTIYRPWNDTNLFHDLYYTTSLDASIQWNFVMRCVYTNDVVADLCSPIGFFRLGPSTNGNLAVSTNATPQQLAELLVPPWVTVTNATYTGTNVARGTFAGGNGSGLPIDSGVILSSGPITNAIGPNTDDGSIAAGTGYSGPSNLGEPGDADLSKLVGNGPTLDAAVLEFDVISSYSFTLQFEYIFASEEYPEWIAYPPSGFNDPMAIFVSTNRMGTNWINSITNDFALVPGTTNLPVSVNSINGGCVSDADYGYDSPNNAQYYVDNHDPNWLAVSPNATAAPAFNIQYDGMTVLLTAQVPITANVTNHIKIAIADYAGTTDDDIYDSAVILKPWSPCQ